MTKKEERATRQEHGRLLRQKMPKHRKLSQLSCSPERILAGMAVQDSNGERVMITVNIVAWRMREYCKQLALRT